MNCDRTENVIAAFEAHCADNKLLSPVDRNALACKTPTNFALTVQRGTEKLSKSDLKNSLRSIRKKCKSEVEKYAPPRQLTASGQIMPVDSRTITTMMGNLDLAGQIKTSYQMTEYSPFLQSIFHGNDALLGIAHGSIASKFADKEAFEMALEMARSSNPLFRTSVTNDLSTAKYVLPEVKNAYGKARRELEAHADETLAQIQMLERKLQREREHLQKIEQEELNVKVSTRRAREVEEELLK